MHKFSVKTYLIAMVMVLVAVPLGIFWIWPHSQALENELSEVRERHLLIARNLGMALDRYHRDVQAAFDDASLTLSRLDTDKSEARLLESLNMRSVCMFDPLSGELTSEMKGSQACPKHLSRERIEALEKNLAGRQKAMSGVEETPDGDLVIHLAKITEESIFVSAVGTEYFRQLGKAIAFGKKGHAAIVDQHGTVLSHPLDSWVKTRKNIAKVSAVKRMMSGEQGVETFYSPALKDDMVAGFTSVKEAGWGVMVPQPVSELKEKAGAIQLSTILVFTWGVCIAGLAASLIARMIMKPLRQMTSAARQMAKDSASAPNVTLSHYVPLEFEEMADAFNAMASHVVEAQRHEAEARAKAEAANDSKTKFLRAVTHELRSPLNAVIGFADLLSDDRMDALSDDERKEYAKDIAGGGRHMLSLTNDLLDLARIEAGRYQLNEEAVDIEEIGRRAARFVDTQAERRDMVVEVSSDPGLPDILGDERSLFQSVLNLLSNAVRYGRNDGRIQLNLNRHTNGDLVIEIADDGPGIPPEDLQRVLKPFERVAGTDPNIQGSGLGLPIVCKLAELHGGRFELTSELGVGTTARIVLPADRCLDEQPLNSHMATSTSPGTGRHLSDVKGKLQEAA